MEENKGFSLVELVIVIAIMAVLVAILAPLFIKYVEQSRRSRDIQTADRIREAFLAEGSTAGAGSVEVEINASYLPGTINETPTVAGHVFPSGGTFTAVYDADANEVGVYVTVDYESGHPQYNLTTEAGISAYRAA